MVGNSKPYLMVGLLVGAAAGTAVALLLAPTTGKQSRELVRQRTGEIAGAVKNRLKSIWANGNGYRAEVNASGGPEGRGEAPSAVEPGRCLREGLDWCEEHQVAY